MRKILLLLVLIGISFSANYPTVPKVFGPGSLIPINYLNQDFSAVNSVFTSGLYRVNFNELYINGSLFADSNRNMYLQAGVITGNLALLGNLTVRGTTTATFNTFIAPITTVTTMNITTATINYAAITNATINTLVCTTATINTAIVTTLSATTIAPLSGSSVVVNGNLTTSTLSAPLFSTIRGGYNGEFTINKDVITNAFTPNVASANYVYTATSDAIVSAIVFNSSTSYSTATFVSIYSDASTTPNTVLAIRMVPSPNTNTILSISAPIKKGNKWWVASGSHDSGWYIRMTQLASGGL